MDQTRDYWTGETRPDGPACMQKSTQRIFLFRPSDPLVRTAYISMCGPMPEDEKLPVRYGYMEALTRGSGAGTNAMVLSLKRVAKYH